MPVITETRIETRFEAAGVTFFVTAVPWGEKGFRVTAIVYWDTNGDVPKQVYMRLEGLPTLTRKTILDKIVSEWNEYRREDMVKRDDAYLVLPE